MIENPIPNTKLTALYNFKPFISSINPSNKPQQMNKQIELWTFFILTRFHPKLRAMTFHSDPYLYRGIDIGHRVEAI